MGKIVINQTDEKQTVILTNDAEGITGVYFGEDGVEKNIGDVFEWNKILKSLGDGAITDSAVPETLYFPQVTKTATSSISHAAGMKYLILPALLTIGTYGFADNGDLEGVDIGSAFTGSIPGWCFSGAKLKKLILRKESTVSLTNVNAFGGTLFDNDNEDAYLYVPSSLIQSYQEASNWSTVLGRAKNHILALEDSEYATHYVDGTPIE